MNVLLVSYSAPPMSSPRSIRVARIGRALLDAGDRVEVLTVDAGGPDQKLVQMLDNARFVRTPPGPMERREHARNTAPSASATKGASVLHSGVAGRLRASLAHAVIPDLRAEWIPRALDPRLQLTRPDVVISMSPWFSNVVVGDALARRFKAAHVVDYGDPWSLRIDYPNPPWRRRIDRALEARLLSRAAGAILSTEPQARLVRESFRKAPRVAVVTNGYDPDDYVDDPGPIDGSLRHLGNLYSPRLSFDCLGPAMARVGPWDHLDLYGIVVTRDASAVPDWLHLRDRVSFAESLRLMQTAAGLLVIGNRAALQIPSKIFNYVGAGRPVLALVESLQDPMTALGLGDQVIFARPELDEVTRGLEQLAERTQQTFTPPSSCSWPSLGAQYRRQLLAWS